MAGTVHVTAVPRELAALPLRTFRPEQATGVYTQPRVQLRRLQERGAVHRLAHGYYVVVPQENLGEAWMPTLEAAAAGIATAHFGANNVVLMGVTAARMHGAIPRAISTAVVAVPAQRNAIALADRDATVQFVKRDTAALDAEAMPTELGRVLVTTPEQTLLDLAHRPTLGRAEDQVDEAIRALLARAEPDTLERIADTQRLRAALTRARERTA